VTAMVLTSFDADDPTFHLIHSTKWTLPKASMEDEVKLFSAAMQKTIRKLLVHTPHCCELTSLAFCQLVAQAARAQGFRVVR